MQKNHSALDCLTPGVLEWGSALEYASTIHSKINYPSNRDHSTAILAGFLKLLTYNKLSYNPCLAINLPIF